MWQLRGDLLDGPQTSIQDDLELREVLAQPSSDVVSKRWNLAILLGAEPLQDCPSRVHDENVASGCGNRGDEALQELIFIERPRHRLNADSAFHCHRNAHALTDGGDAVSHQFGLCHETRSKAPALHAIARTSAIQVDLVIAELLADACRSGELARIATAELQRHRMLLWIEGEQPLPIAPDDRRRR